MGLHGHAHVGRERVGFQRRVIHAPRAVGVEMPREEPLPTLRRRRLVEGELEACVLLLHHAGLVQRSVAGGSLHAERGGAPLRDALHDRFFLAKGKSALDLGSAHQEK